MKDNITNQTNIANKTNYQFKILHFIGIIQRKFQIGWSRKLWIIHLCKI